MPLSNFKAGEPQKRTLAEILSTAKQKDAENSKFNLPAETGEILTLTGEFFECPYTINEGTAEQKSGVMLMFGAERANKEKLNLPLTLLRTKKRIGINGIAEFIGCFKDSDTFETIVKSLSKGKKIKVVRGEWCKPNLSFPVTITTLVWAL